jgi:hypothetical protein
MTRCAALPEGACITNTFDVNARLLSTLANSGGTNLDAESYAYNQASQRIGETNTAGDYRNYTYDNMGELTTALGMEAGGVTNRWQEQLGYAYDAAGNLLFQHQRRHIGSHIVSQNALVWWTAHAGAWAK